MKGTFSAMILALAVAEFGVTGWTGENIAEAAPVSGSSQLFVPEVAISASTSSSGESITDSHNALMEQQVREGVQQLDQSARRLPGYAAQVAKRVEEHGIAGLAIEDPEMKHIGKEIGRDLGRGIRQLAVALGQDMVRSAAGR